MKNLANDLGIESNIEFLGEISDISQILTDSDIKILVLTSLREGMPMSVLEALSFSIPVIATNVGDIPEVVLNGKTGYVLPTKDYKGLAGRSLSYWRKTDDR